MGRIKELNRQESNRRRRKRKPVVYLICEGKKTEILYFKKFKSRNCLVDIIPIESQYKAADKLVTKAKNSLGQNQYYPEDGDTLWCVFDRDDNTEDALRKARDTAKKAGYNIAYSNPCFELWYLLHFVNQKGYVENCSTAINLLTQRGRFSSYEKNQEIFDKILPMQEKAISYCEKRITQLEKEHIEIISRNSNPLTTVSKLVTYLNQCNR